MPKNSQPLSPLFLLLLLLHSANSSPASPCPPSLLLLLQALPSISSLSCIQCELTNCQGWKILWPSHFHIFYIIDYNSCVAVMGRATFWWQKNISANFFAIFQLNNFSNSYDSKAQEAEKCKSKELTDDPCGCCKVRRKYFVTWWTIALWFVQNWGQK